MLLQMLQPENVFFFFFLNLWVFFVLEEETSYECMLYAGIKKSGNMITYFNVGNVGFEVLFATSIYIYLYTVGVVQGGCWQMAKLVVFRQCRFSPMSLHQQRISVIRFCFFSFHFFFVSFWYTSLVSIIIYMWLVTVCRVPCATNAYCGMI